MTESAPAAPRRSAPEFSLRVPTNDDAATWFQLFNDPVVMQYISGGVVQPQEWYLAFVSRQQALAAATGVCLFALVVPTVASAVCATTPAAGARSGAVEVLGADATPGADLEHRVAGPHQFAGPHRVAGFVGLQPWTRPWGPAGCIEIGWRLGVAFQGHGLATAGAQAALERGRAAGIEFPIAMIDLRNTPSIGVATKLGMSCADEFDAPDGVRVGMWSL